MELNVKRKIAVPTNAGMLDPHFGHCKQYTIYDVDNTDITSEEVVDAPPHEPGLLPKWLSERDVTDILAGGMGKKAIDLFNSYKVNVMVGAPEIAVKEIIEGFLNNTISFTNNYCDH